MRCCTSRFDEADSDSQDIAADAGLSLPITPRQFIVPLLGHCGFVYLGERFPFVFGFWKKRLPLFTNNL
jgi:hypothetical protein